MSVYASRWATDRLADPECPLTGQARTLLLLLAIDAHYQTGQAFTGRARAAAVLGCHWQTAWRAVQQLRAWPHLPHTERPGHGICWFFPVAQREAADPTPGTRPVVPTGRAHATGQISTPVAPVQSTGRAHATPPVAPTRPKGLGTDVEKEGAALRQSHETETRRVLREEADAAHTRAMATIAAIWESPL